MHSAILRVSGALLTLGLVITTAGCGKKDSTSTTTTSASGAASALAIPTTPFAGQLGGQPFTLKKLSLVTGKGFKEWRVSVEGSTPTASTAAVRLPVRAPLGMGKTFESRPTMLTPGATVAGLSVQNGANNTSTTDATIRIEITKWDVKPCPTDDAPTHEGGLASGRMFIKVPAENVELSGTFTDAPVSYRQTPDWTYQ